MRVKETEKTAITTGPSFLGSSVLTWRNFIYSRPGRVIWYLVSYLLFYSFFHDSFQKLLVSILIAGGLLFDVFYRRLNNDALHDALLVSKLLQLAKLNERKAELDLALKEGKTHQAKMKELNKTLHDSINAKDRELLKEIIDMWVTHEGLNEKAKSQHLQSGAKSSRPSESSQETDGNLSDDKSAF